MRQISLNTANKTFTQPTKQDFVVKKHFKGESTFNDIINKYIPLAIKETKPFAKAIKLSLPDESDFVFNNDYEREVCFALYIFCKQNIKYKLDREGLEEIRLPNKTWADRKKGVDCEDFVIFLSGILHNLKISHTIKMVDFGEGWQHIYIKVGKVVLDPVQDSFDYESPYKRSKTHFYKISPNTSLGKVDVESQLTQNEIAFGASIILRLLSDTPKLNKIAVDKLAKENGITDTIHIKELVELNLVKVCRSIALGKDKYWSSPLYIDNNGHYANPIDKRFNLIKDIYQKQPILSQRTSNSILLQQYSTPAPIAFLCGEYVKEGKLEFKGQLFEPTAGNGMMTIDFMPQQCCVNELDELRYRNLTTQGFAVASNRNAKDLKYIERKFQGVITNPPFETLPKDEYETFDGYTIKHLDHLLAIYALDAMADNGRASIIIGGHTEYEKNGVLLNGKNRVFLSYLYSHYNVEDVINVNGDLYARQGTGFDIRLILINGRKKVIGGFAPLRDNAKPEVVNTFDELYDRIFSLFDTANLKPEIPEIDLELKRRILSLKYKYKALAQLQELELTNQQ